jgi:hypothetical protein
MAVLKSVEWMVVDSSLFTAVAYRADARQLYLRFHAVDIYRYFDFPVQVYKAFLSAESKGRYFSHHIRNAFRYERVRRGHRRAAHALAQAGCRESISAAPQPMQPV